MSAEQSALDLSNDSVSTSTSSVQYIGSHRPLSEVSNGTDSGYSARQSPATLLLPTPESSGPLQIAIPPPPGGSSLPNEISRSIREILSGPRLCFGDPATSATMSRDPRRTMIPTSADKGMGEVISMRPAAAEALPNTPERRSTRQSSTKNERKKSTPVKILPRPPPETAPTERRAKSSKPDLLKPAKLRILQRQTTTPATGEANPPTSLSLSPVSPVDSLSSPPMLRIIEVSSLSNDPSDEILAETGRETNHVTLSQVGQTSPSAADSLRSIFDSE